jgi:hypothetical protein
MEKTDNTQTIDKQSGVLVPEERPHHPYSPSTLANREWCPMFRNRQPKEVHHRTTAGTRAHGMVETGEDDERLSDNDAVAAAECMDFVDQRRRIMGSGTELSEIYLEVDDRVFPDCRSTTAGYVDRVLLNSDKTYAEMFDWKFGMWPVDGAEENLQGIAYTLGLFRKYPSLKKIRFFFKQPLLQVTSDHEFTRDMIPALYLRIQTVVARARKANDELAWDMANPAVPVCNFCDRLGECPKVRAMACKVGHKFHPIEVPEDITPSLPHSPEDCSMLLKLAGVLKVWCESARRQVTDRIIRGDAELPPGQRIQEMQKRKVVDNEKIKTVALKYLTAEEFDTTLEATFGKIEDLISEKAPRGQKESTVKEFQKALLDSGAVVMGDKFSFLRAVAEKGK